MQVEPHPDAEVLLSLCHRLCGEKVWGFFIIIVIFGVFFSSRFTSSEATSVGAGAAAVRAEPLLPPLRLSGLPPPPGRDRFCRRAGREERAGPASLPSF